MTQSMPLLRPAREGLPTGLDGGGSVTIVEQSRTPELDAEAVATSVAATSVAPASKTPGPVEPSFVARLLTGWSVGSEVIDEAEALTGQLTRLAEDQGHGLTAMSVSFADRRLRVTVVDQAGEDGSGAPAAGRWFELSRGPAGPGAQPEPAVRFNRST